MTTKTLMESQVPPSTSPPQGLIPRRRPPTRRWQRRGLFASVLVVLLVSAVALIRAATSSQDMRPQFTHTITRGDLLVTVIEQGILESSENTEIKCKVRGRNTVIWVIKSGSLVQPGQELLKLDRLFIQEQIDERTKYANWSQSSADRSKANVARATLAVGEYAEGRYLTELMGIETELVVAEAALRSAKNRLSYAEILAKSEYISELKLDERKFAVEQADLNVKLTTTKIDVLSRFTHAEQLQTLTGRLAATTARHKANAERATADASRRDRALDEIQYCTITADRAGLVIHPNAAKWETAPIAEGSRVHKNQILLLMPDLTKMQVKVGIHESIVDRIQEGMQARVTLSDQTLDGEVSSVASVTRPAGWWTGNEVRYDTLIRLPAGRGLRPGMSAEVEVVIARYENVLSIPVAAIVDSDDDHFCWVKTATGVRKRKIVLGDSNDVFTIVKEGLQEGDEVMLNPQAHDNTRSDAKITSDKANAPAEKSYSK